MIGFVGCGRMGGPMLRRLLAAGRPVRAFDTDERALAAAAQAGAEPAEGPAGAARDAEVVITMLPDPATVASAGSDMLGGPATLVERARPLLETLGSNLVHVGDRPGDGDTAKTLNNMLSATNLAAAAEALAMGIRAGLDPGRLVDCVN